MVKPPFSRFVISIFEGLESVRLLLTAMILFLGFVVSSPAMAQAEVKVRPDKVKLGEAFTFVIKGEYLSEALSKLDLEIFTENFVIDDYYQDSNIFRLKLYPLREGRFVIPKQQAKHIKIPELELLVECNPDVKVEGHSPEKQAYSQQLIPWFATVTVNNSAFKVSYVPQEYNSNNKLEELISETATNTTSDQSTGLFDAIIGSSHHLSAAYVMPGVNRAQTISFHSPMIQVKNRGNKRWKFFDRPRQIKVKPLPNFLPLSAAVAKIEWQLEPINWSYEAGQLHHWQWTLRSRNLTKDYLQGSLYQLIRQLEAAKNIEFFSETIDSKQRFVKDGVISELKVTIPYRLTSTGLASFPALSLRYFDPETGKVGLYQQSESWALALPSWLIWLLQWLLLVLVMAGLFTMLVVIKQAVLNWRFKQAIELALTKENTVDEIWQAMYEWQKNHRRWKINWQAWKTSERQMFQKLLLEVDQVFNESSLAQWQEWHQFFYASDPRLETLINQLNQYYYAENKRSPEQVNKVKELVAEWARLS